MANAASVHYKLDCPWLKLCYSHMLVIRHMDLIDNCIYRMHITAFSLFCTVVQITTAHSKSLQCAVPSYTHIW
jgi:hypothetical protein